MKRRPPRQKGNATVKEAWTLREKSLGDFLAPSSGPTLSQNSKIEWSSSDEDDAQSQPTYHTVIATKAVTPFTSTTDRAAGRAVSNNQIISASASNTDRYDFLNTAEFFQNKATFNSSHQTTPKCKTILGSNKSDSFALEVKHGFSGATKRILPVDFSSDINVSDTEFVVDRKHSRKLSSNRNGSTSTSPVLKQPATKSLTRQKLIPSPKASCIPQNRDEGDGNSVPTVAGEGNSVSYVAKSNFFASAQKTPAKSASKVLSEDEDSVVSPVLGLRCNQSASEIHPEKTKISESSQEDRSDSDPSSPIIGLEKVIKRKIVFNPRNNLCVENVRGTHKKSLTDTFSTSDRNEAMCTPQRKPDIEGKQLNDNGDVTALSSLKRNLILDCRIEDPDATQLSIESHHESTHKTSPPLRFTDDDSSLTMNMPPHKKITMDSQTSSSRPSSSPTLWQCKNEDTELTDGHDEFVECQAPQTGYKFSEMRESLFREAEDSCNDRDYLEYFQSQNTTSPTENKVIESEITLSQISTSSVLTPENSHEPIISTTVSAASADALEPNSPEALKTGSHWLRSLGMQTPEKREESEVAETGIESSKKKTKKHGHAERLKRLIQSWQSGVHIWKHQMMLSDPQNTKTKMLESNATKEESTHLSVLLSPPEGVKKVKKELLWDDPRKILFSPPVKLLCDNLTGSQGTPVPLTNSFSGQTSELNKKCLELRIMRLGGNLPHNFALCRSLGNLSVIKTETELKEAKSEKAKQYMVVFAIPEQKTNPTLKVDDFVKLFSPWQQLELPLYHLPVLFTSYFLVNDKLLEDSTKCSKPTESRTGTKTSKVSNNKTLRSKKELLTSWTCSCSSNLSTVPTSCDSRQCVIPPPVQLRSQQLITVQPGLSTVKDLPKDSQIQSECRPDLTVLEAIEKCGGVSDIPVSITIRIHRITCKSQTDDELKEWEIIGQDAGGFFCTVTIPDRPLIQQLGTLLENGEGSTYTFSCVTVTQRLTNSQKPSLFSLISSLHAAYQSAVKNNPQLISRLHDHSIRPPQTFCYVFSFLLGVTEALSSPYEVVIPISLPSFSLEAMQDAHDGQRGDMKVHILYKIESLLYVMSQPSLVPGNIQSSNQITGTLRENTNTMSRYGGQQKSMRNMGQGDYVVMPILMYRRAAMPSWMTESGTVMQTCILRDIVAWNGNVLVDEYSKIIQEESRFQVSLSMLHDILQVLSSTSQLQDLVLVSGVICGVEEETAYTWVICERCESDNIEETESGTECRKCGHSSSDPGTGYFLEVWLNCGTQLQNVNVKVTLYQRTIKKLLDSCYLPGGEGYDSGSLVGQKVGGPLVCVVQKISRSNTSSHLTYTLLQLPY